MARDRRHREVEGRSGQARTTGRRGDPRNRQAHQADLVPIQYQSPVRVDSQGRVGLQKLKDPGAPPTEGLPDETASWLTGLYQDMKRKGYMEGS